MNRAFQHLTPRARTVIQQAEREARGLGHAFVGTEHILLAFVAENPESIAAVLRTFGVDFDRIRAGVEKLVVPGPLPILGGTLPLTPRAGRALELAGEEAWSVGLSQADTEYLLLGLLREPDGVAGHVLRNLGLPFDRLHNELLRTRFQQMQIVERCVRPVRAGTPRKRKMREELLAHLTEIYRDALERERDPEIALQEAAERFGSPADLARELDNALPRSEHRSYYIERCFGWRAPESAAKWVLRLAAYLFLLFAVLGFGGLAAAAVAAGGTDFIRWSDLRGAIAFVTVFPAAMIACGLLYFRIRDSLFGMFGRRKSVGNVLLAQLLMATSVTVCGVAYVALAEWNIERGYQFLLPYALAGIAAAMAALAAARINGPREYRDALWACVDIREASNGDSREPA
jgi:hypothetical protein